MSFKGKPVSVKITGDAEEAYERLNKIVGGEISKGITKSDNQKLFKSIKQKIQFLKENPQYGTHVSKTKIPREYLIEYDINNLWKVDLAGAWRLIYTIRGSEIEIIALILDLLNHKDYSKKFGYKK